MRTLILLTAVVGALSQLTLSHPEPRSSACVAQDNELSQAALQFINDHHFHGYKYRLTNNGSGSIRKDDSSCEYHIELDLEETKCHVVNPKPFDQCDFRETEDTKVKANCNVTLSVTEGKPQLKKYSCNSAPDSAEELVAVCPDCPTLLRLNDPQGLKSIEQALKKFNQESNDSALFKLLEVGRLSTQYMMLGQSFFSEFAIVETGCSRGAEPDNKEACRTLCHSDARHGLCSSTLLGNDEVTVDCEIYDAQNKTGRVHHHHHHHHPHPGGPPGKPCGHPGHPWQHTRPAGPPPHRPHHPDHPGQHTRPAGPPPHRPHHPDHPGQHTRPAGPPPFPPHPPVNTGQHTHPTGPPPHPPYHRHPPFFPHRFPNCSGQLKIHPSIYPICPPPPFIITPGEPPVPQ